MVSKESAVLCTGADALHDQLSRDVGHFELAKFSSRADYDYIAIRGRIIECVKAAPDVITDRLVGAGLAAGPGDRDTRPVPLGEWNQITPVVTEQECVNNFRKFLDGEKKALRVFYSDDGAIRKLVPTAKTMVDHLFAIGYTKQTALELSILILYDVVMLIDDSSSMESEQGGERIKTLIGSVDKITSIYDLANPTGIKSIRFVNSKETLTNITNQNSTAALSERMYSGLTRLGTALYQNILTQFVWNAPMTKPLLVMIVTDGEAEGEREGLLEDVIKRCIAKLGMDPARGKQAVAFTFSRVGDDIYDHEGVRELADSTSIGECIDFGGALEKLSDPKQRYKYAVMPKLLLGAIMTNWKIRDEDFDV